MNCSVDELSVDPSYQRSIDNPTSRALIKKIAREWDWSLFQLLVVSRRPDGELYVVDGQHRLEAARLRGDLRDLPCSVYDFRLVSHEADAFVALNQQRKPLTRLDLFKGAVIGGGDTTANHILALITGAGLTLAPHTNYACFKPGQIAAIGGICKAYKMAGPDITARALAVLANAYRGEVLRFAGTIFPAIVATIVDLKLPRAADDLLEVTVSGLTQLEWAEEINRTAVQKGIGRPTAAAQALIEVYLEAASEDGVAAA
ncbi:hypothetical protein AQZ49_01835 [Novosphingobium sp. FSW06-99]|nr:hypothetical protein AQZ49_01835 [Novosphingobium sp. FSW06-99]